MSEELVVLCKCARPMRRQRQDQWGKSRWQCRGCGSDVQLRDDVWDVISTQALAGGLTEVTEAQLMRAVQAVKR